VRAVKQSILLRCLWVEHLTPNPEIEVSNPGTGVEREKTAGKKSFIEQVGLRNFFFFWCKTDTINVLWGTKKDGYMTQTERKVSSRKKVSWPQKNCLGRKFGFYVWPGSDSLRQVARGFVKQLSWTFKAHQSVTKFIAMVVINLVTPYACSWAWPFVRQTGALFRTLHFHHKLGIGPISYIVYPWQAIPSCVILRSSLLGQLITYKENEALWIWFLRPFLYI
jgi:hypothetical protein